jgi:hypothetical protein
MIEKIKNIIKKNKILIIKISFIILWIFLFLLNYITNIRLIVFFIIILVIYIYKWLIKKANKMKPIKNINILLLLIYIDKIKLIWINLIIRIYVWLFDLLELTDENKIVKGLEILLKSIIINPLLLIIHKFYYLLYIWESSSIKSIFISRLFGMILVVLIFSPLLRGIYILLGSNLLNVYILIIIMSILDDNRQKLKNYKIFNFILSIIGLLRLNKDLSFIFEYRNKVSTLVIIIKKSVNIIRNRKSIVNNYAFQLNNIYSSILLRSRDNLFLDKSIIDYENKLKEGKVIKMKESIVDSYSPLFRSYYLKIIYKFKDNLDKLALIRYYKIQKIYEITKENLIKLKKIEEIIYLLIKLILFYLWNLTKLIGYSNIEIFNELEINTNYECELKYIIKPLLRSDKSFKKVNKIIKAKHFYLYRDYYEQMYLYVHLWDFHHYDKDEVDNGINCNEYTYINEYIDIFKESTSIINEDWLQLESFRTQSTEEQEEIIHNWLEKYKNKLIKEWEEQSLDLSVDNFYEKNNKNLNELNNYVKKEILENKINKKKIKLIKSIDNIY